MSTVSSIQTDALIIGAGPAGSATAMLLARAGWRVVLAEKTAFPRQKVCGECLSAGTFSLLDRLGIGVDVRRMAGPELRRIGWIGRGAMVVAAFPACEVGADRYGRAVGRDYLDDLMLEHARRLGVTVLQPAKVRSVRGRPGDFLCAIDAMVCHARVVIDAHGSWESGPVESESAATAADSAAPQARAAADLFAFKARFQDSTLAPGLLPVIAFDGGYGGLVVAEGGRTTVACCIRRDALKACRASLPGTSAGAAVTALLRRSCPSLQAVLEQPSIGAAWLSVGPLRPGIRVGGSLDTFRVGNAAGETHPLIGEGISMALQSAGLLAQCLGARPALPIDSGWTWAVNRRYGAAWRRAFTPRLRFAAGYAHATMRPAVSGTLQTVLEHWPSLLTRAARWAGKARVP